MRAWLDRRRRERLARRAAPGPLRAFYEAAPPDLDADWRATPFLALDLETTGLDPARDALLAVGFVAVEGGGVRLGTARYLPVRTEREVGVSATVHGITDTAAAEGAAPAEALGAVLEALAGRVLVAHHAPLDVGVLDAACRRHFGAPLVVPTVDTLALEARVFRRRDEAPPEGALRLAACRARYGLPLHTAHHALGDALATAELLLAQTAHRARGGALPARFLLA